MTFLQQTQVSRQRTIPKKQRNAWHAGAGCETQHLSRAQLHVLSSSKSPSHDTALPEVSRQLPMGLNAKQSTSFVSTARRDFTTCVSWEHPAHAGRAASPAGTSQPDESIRLAMPPRPASCYQIYLEDRTLVSKSNLHKYIHAPICTEEPREPLLAGHSLPKMLMPHSITSPFRAAESPKRPSLNDKSAPVTEIFSRTQHDN